MVYLELAGCVLSDVIFCKHLSLLGRAHVAHCPGVASHADLLRRHAGEDSAGRAMSIRHATSRHAACMRCATRCRSRIEDCGGCVPTFKEDEERGEEEYFFFFWFSSSVIFVL